MSIAFDRKNKWFYVNQKLKGLHDILARKFYPEGSVHANIKHYRYKGKSKHKLLSASGSSVAPPLTPRRAKNLGSRVDRQMKILVEKCGDDPLKLRYWTTFKRERTLADYVEKSKKPLKRMEPYTAAGIRCLLDNSWMPVACQVPVGSAVHGLATAVDVECRHTKDKTRRAIVEVKVGYDGSWDADTGQRFSRPLEMLRDSDRNKAHLQVACTALLEKATFQRNKLAEMYVLRISRTQGPSLESLEPNIRSRLQEVANALVQSK
jgi:hypothetical protein